MNSKLPQNWFQKDQPIDQQNQEKNEKLIFFISYEILTPKEPIQETFYVTQKENKAIAKNLISRQQETQLRIIAEYPIEETQTLINETKESALKFAINLIETNTLIKTNTNKPLFGLELKNGMSKTEILEELEIRKNDYPTEAKEILKNMVKNLPEIMETTEKLIGFQMPEIIKTNDTKINPKQEQEKELIKKFGKKNLEKLAKQMNYHGTLINKLK